MKIGSVTEIDDVDGGCGEVFDQEPAGVVRHFITDMHNWEVRVAADNRTVDRKSHDAFYQRACASLAEVFARWCTPKERKYGRLGSFSRLPEYQPEHERIGETVVESPRRACVLTRRGTGFQEQRKYILVKRGGRWLIDSVKWRTHDGEAWTNGIL